MAVNGFLEGGDLFLKEIQTMRIIAGAARGIHLMVQEEGEELRPTEDRVKESLFSTLGDLTGASVLDLFSGTGALGLEALSRGAAKVVMVERDPRHAEVIQDNLGRVRQAIVSYGNVPGETQILVTDVAHIAEQLTTQCFSVILADPPYHPDACEYGARQLLLDERWSHYCSDQTLLALEHATDVRDLPWSPRSHWRFLRKRSFGIRTVSYAKLASSTQGDGEEEFV